MVILDISYQCAVRSDQPGRFATLFHAAGNDLHEIGVTAHQAVIPCGRTALIRGLRPRFAENFALKTH